MSAVDILSETELEVRDALPDDVHAIAALASGMLHGRASFEEVPLIDEMRQRMKSALIAVCRGWSRLYRGIVVGYCYATLTARVSLPLYPGRVDLRGCQHHRTRCMALMDALIARCEKRTVAAMMAIVGDGNNNRLVAIAKAWLRSGRAAAQRRL
jgi:phosphinothricin acetyltransferase